MYNVRWGPKKTEIWVSFGSQSFTWWEGECDVDGSKLQQLPVTMHKHNFVVIGRQVTENKDLIKTRLSLP